MLLHRPKPRHWIASAALLSLVFTTGPAPADIYYESVYLPTSTVYSMPTSSSLLSTSYVVPTSYSSTYIPTSYTSTYIPTSYTSTYIPTSTVLSTDSVLVPTTTTYYRPSIFPSRRLVQRTSYSYAPTSYLMPTSYLLPTTYVSSSVLRPTSYLIDDGVVTTSLSSSPCDTSPTVAPTRATNKPQASNNGSGNGAAIVSEPTNASSPSERKPSATYNSIPSDEAGKSSDVSPPVPGPTANPAPATTTPPNPPATAPATTEKAPMPEPPALGSGEAPRAPATQPATSPDGGIVLPPAGKIGGSNPNEMMFRQARKPAYDTRNILRGKVMSAETNRPEEGVTVIISNLNKTFTDRQAMTDADGEFKISLPDGDWTVKVKTESGRLFNVGQGYVTASNGRITDASGRNVAEVKIAR